MGPLSSGEPEALRAEAGHQVTGEGGGGGRAWACCPGTPESLLYPVGGKEVRLSVVSLLTCHVWWDTAGALADAERARGPVVTEPVQLTALERSPEWQATRRREERAPPPFLQTPRRRPQRDPPCSCVPAAPRWCEGGGLLKLRGRTQGRAGGRGEQHRMGGRMGWDHIPVARPGNEGGAACVTALSGTRPHGNVIK